jgi:dual specificity tyrosine-phosphorylation-regulated kinase 2/3/4
VKLHDHLAYRYEILEPLGSGSFGQVVRCFDHQTKQETAIKIVRNRKKYKEQSMVEVQLLQQLRQSMMMDNILNSSGGNEDEKKNQKNLQHHHHIVQMKDYFFFRQHLCISFEKLGMNLYEFIKFRSFQGLQMNNLRLIATQILQALIFLKQQKIIHCDLKPENILLPPTTIDTGMKNTGTNTGAIGSISVIDFGSSCYEDATFFTYIQSRFYRSPEVILGFEFGYSFPIDMWSFGCILAELFTGHPLFVGENEAEQIACMMEILDIPHRDFLIHCKRRDKFFFQEDYSSSLFVPLHLVNSRGRKRQPGTKHLSIALKTSDTSFLNFLQACLEWNPLKRMTPEKALQHSWIQQELY